MQYAAQQIVYWIAQKYIYTNELSIEDAMMLHISILTRLDVENNNKRAAPKLIRAAIIINL